MDYVDIVTRWVQKETAICKRVLRLRAYLYLKIPWVETFDLVRHLLRQKILCEVPGKGIWMTDPQYLGPDSQFIGEHRAEFAVKEDVYNRWVNQSTNLGYYAEGIFKRAFLDAGYSVSKIRFEYPSGLLDALPGYVEIDAFCIKKGWHLGVQVKNVTSTSLLTLTKLRNLPRFIGSLRGPFNSARRLV